MKTPAKKGPSWVPSCAHPAFRLVTESWLYPNGSLGSVSLCSTKAKPTRVSLDMLLSSRAPGPAHKYEARGQQRHCNSSSSTQLVSIHWKSRTHTCTRGRGP